MKIPENQLRMENLRLLLDMSQRDMSEYLGVGRPLVARYEKKIRTLNGMALKRFYMLTNHLRNTDIPTKDSFAPLKGPEMKVAKQDLIRKCQTKLLRIENKLESEHEVFFKMQAARYYIEKMQADSSMPKADVREFKLWKAQHIAARDNEIRRFYCSTILKLEAQQKACQAEIAFLKRGI